MDRRTLVARRDTLLEAEIDGELMGLNVERALCYGFNATATDLWKLIETPQTLGALCADLQKRYDVEPAQCEADVATSLRAMEAHGLVELTAATP